MLTDARRHTGPATSGGRRSVAPAAFDAAAALAAVVIAVLCTVSGLHTGWKHTDTDELVYRRTLVAMQHGQGFYDAQRAALVAKEHEPPTSVRAVRPPTLYLVLSLLPARSWRWLVGLVYGADLLLAWRLARAYGSLGGLVAVLASGLWLYGDSSFLFLHAEVWGLPFALGGMLLLRRRQVWAAAGAILVAACIRELYAAGLVFAAVAEASGPLWALWGGGWDQRAAMRRVARALGPWLVAGALAVGLYGVHTVLAARVLSTHGYNARFGNERRSLAFLLRLVSPIVSTPGAAFGIVASSLGLVGAARAARRDPAAVVGGGLGGFLLAAAVWATRAYWSACWAIPLTVLAPAAWGMGVTRPAPEPVSRRRLRAPGRERPCP